MTAPDERSAFHSSPPANRLNPTDACKHAVGGQLQRLVAERRCGTIRSVGDEPFVAVRDGAPRRDPISRCPSWSRLHLDLVRAPRLDPVERARRDPISVDDPTVAIHDTIASSLYGTAITSISASGSNGHSRPPDTRTGGHPTIGIDLGVGHCSTPDVRVGDGAATVNRSISATCSASSTPDA